MDKPKIVSLSEFKNPAKKPDLTSLLKSLEKHATLEALERLSKGLQKFIEVHDRHASYMARELLKARTELSKLRSKYEN